MIATFCNCEFWVLRLFFYVNEINKSSRMSKCYLLMFEKWPQHLSFEIILVSYLPTLFLHLIFKRNIYFVRHYRKLRETTWLLCIGGKESILFVLVNNHYWSLGEGGEGGGRRLHPISPKVRKLEGSWVRRFFSPKVRKLEKKGSRVRTKRFCSLKVHDSEIMKYAICLVRNTRS